MKGMGLLNQAYVEFRGVFRFGWVREEDLVDSFCEDTGEVEGQGQARVIFAGFDGIDGLPRHVEFLGKPRLGPVVLRSQDLDAISHWGCQYCMA